MLFINIVLSLIISYYLTRYLIGYLTKRNIIDTPNHRTSHEGMIPRGGGLAMVISIMICGLLYYSDFTQSTTLLNLFVALLIASAVSFWDDVKTAPIIIRLAGQIVAVYFAMRAIPDYDHTVLFHFLPLTVEKFLVGFGLLSFMNLYNFMDGIDGLTATQSIYISAIVSLFAMHALPDHDFVAFICAIVIGSCVGFLIHNWHPAKIFLGDIGSVSLGLLCGWMLITAGVNGYLAAVTILPGYYFADGVVTIFRRLARGEKVWEPHSQHFFQQAVKHGKSHSQVVGYIILCNIGLAVLSGLSIYLPKMAFFLTIIYLFFIIRRMY